MRLSREQIKSAILHPDRDVCEFAVKYFSNAMSSDTTVMPLLIESLQTYGRVASPRLLIGAAKLAQSTQTMDWCLEELRRDVGGDQDVPAEIAENYLLAISRIVANADPGLLQDKLDVLLEMPNFAEEFHESVRSGVGLLDVAADELWNKLDALCEEAQTLDEFYEIDLEELSWFVTALSRHREWVEPKVLEILDVSEIDFEDLSLACRQCAAIRLAGALQLESAIDPLVKMIHPDDELAFNEGNRALMRIGGDRVVQAVSLQSVEELWESELWIGSILGVIKTDLSFETLMRYFQGDMNPDLKIQFAHDLLSHYDERAIEPVHASLIEWGVDTETRYVASHLAAVTATLEVDCPDIEPWLPDRQAMLEEQWKWYFPTFGGEEFDELDLAAWNKAIDDDWEENVDDDFTASEPNEDDYASPPTTIMRDTPKVGRNEPCPCGSGKKFKKCCMSKPSEETSLF